MKKNTKLSFKNSVYKVVSSIPKGSVLTYKEVARRAGSPNAYRAVGTVLSKNYNPKIPCHRVICSSGALGRYNRGVRRKAEILRSEGYITTKQKEG